MFGKVLGKNVRSADGQMLNSCSIAQFLFDCPIMLGLPKLLPKESSIAELLPSASTFLNTFVSSIPYLAKVSSSRIIEAHLFNYFILSHSVRTVDCFYFSTSQIINLQVKCLCHFPVAQSSLL